MTIQAIVYCAKSTQDRRGSIPAQLAEVRTAIECEGDRAIAGEYHDEAKSAYKGSRGPGLLAAKEAAERLAAERAACELWVFDPDRLARGDGRRGAAHLAQLYWWSVEVGVTLRAVQNDHALRDPIYATVEGQRTHGDSKAKAGHVRRGLQAAFEKGQRGGGPVPDGYQLIVRRDERDRVVERAYRLDPDRAPIIRLAFDLYESGMGDASVARELNRLGHRTRGGRAWERRRVQDLLTNAFYAGRVVRHRGKATAETREGAHPQLVESERFDHLLALRASRDRAVGSARSPRGRPASNHALAGLARCGRCGEPMRPVTGAYRRKRDGGRRRTYLCAHVKSGTGLCDEPSIDAEIVDAAVIANLDSYLGDFNAWLNRIEVGHVAERARIESEVEKAEHALVEQERAVLAVERDYERRLADGAEQAIDAVLSILTRRRLEVDRAEQRVRAARRALATVPRDAPHDGMLDFYLGLKEAVSGRLEGAESMLAVNDALRDLFSRFELTQTPAGVLIRPILHAAAAERIMAGLDCWDHGLALGDCPAVLWRDTVVVLGAEPWDDFSDENLRPADPPPRFAQDVEPIVPPLRTISAPSSKAAFSQA